MADLRKLTLVLAVLALVAATAVPARAQFSCNAAQGQQVPIIRDGGLAELVGDVLMTCSGNAAPVTINFQVFMSTTVTNRTTSNSITANTVSATMIVNEAFAPAERALTMGILQENSLQPGIKTARNSILFANVVVPTVPPGSVATVRISNIRVVAPPTVAGALIQTPVTELITIQSLTPGVTASIPNPYQTVAYVLPGLTFSVVDTCTGSALSGLAFQQCVAEPKGGGNYAQFAVNYKEGFSTAFKTLGANPAGGGQEDDYQWTGSLAGVTTTVTNTADSATRLILRFSNMPTGVHVLVSDTNLLLAAGGAASAGLVAGADSNGAGGTRPSAGDTSGFTTLCHSTPSAGIPTYGHLTEVTGGYAVWEIMSSTSLVDTVTFGIQIKYTPDTSIGSPGLTPAGATVNGGFAPISVVNYADTSSSIPRFVDKTTSGTTFSIVPCVTNLLFPFVTNQAGFDTGIALVNTSLDNSTGASGTPPNAPFNTSTQTGACTLYYFGSMASGGAVPSPQTTDQILPGQMAVALLSGGGVSGATSSAVGFQGYIIARCEFQYAHGYAFIADRSELHMGAQGYLALIIPDRADHVRPPDPFSTAGSGSGEQLTP